VRPRGSFTSAITAATTPIWIPASLCRCNATSKAQEGRDGFDLTQTK
jgi:hypothetical protein